MTVSVSFQSLPAKTPDKDDHRWSLRLVKECTVREVIVAAVCEELAILRAKSPKAPRSVRPWLTGSEIMAQQSTGKISHDSGKRTAPDLSEKDAAAAACQAFSAGRFSLWVDGRQVLELNAKLRLIPTSQVVFLRVVPLMGG